MSGSLDLAALRAANAARQAEWDKDDRIGLAYRGNELAGEVGEVLENAVSVILMAAAAGRAANVAKKIERERLGIRGSRATREDLAAELADVVICVDLIAMAEGIDLAAAVVGKFNATSAKVGLVTILSPATVPPREPTLDMLVAGLTAFVRAVEATAPPLPPHTPEPDTPESAFRRGLIIGGGNGRTTSEMRAVWQAMFDALSVATASHPHAEVRAERASKHAPNSGAAR